MKIPVDWIREYLPIDQSGEEIASLLTSIGFAVDAIETVEQEKVFEIDITTNRPDCMNVLGIARELAAATGFKLTYPKMVYHEGTSSSEDLCRVSIENAALCPRYSGKILKDVAVTSSPPWLEKRIRQIGLRPVNNIVDLSNYVLLELGHPIHIFDFDKIKGKTIIIRNARKGEKIHTIDGIERSLTEDMLVIADKEDPIAIAGIMGGLLSEVGTQTKNIFIESAYFQPRSVRLTSKKLGLSTDASFRFERGADRDMTIKAIDRVAHLILELSKGEASAGHIDVLKSEETPREILLRISRIELLLGIPVSQDKAEKILKSLEMEVKSISKEVLKVTVPSFRVDCKEEIDLIEEVARFMKYDTIPCSIPHATDQQIKGKPDEREKLVSSLLIAAGYSEAINYSMISENEYQRFSFMKNPEPLRIDNPLSERSAVLRNSMLSGLLANVAFNYSRGLKNIKFFEIGKVYAKSSDHPSEESKHIALMATGEEEPTHWMRDHRRIDLWDVKGAAEATLNVLGPYQCTTKPLREEGFFLKEHAFQLQSPDGKSWAIGGQIHPRITQEFKIFQPIYASEIALSELPQSEESRRFTTLSSLPLLTRDLSITIDKGIPFAKIQQTLQEKQERSRIEINLTKIYEGSPIPEGKVSLTLSIRIHQKERTLTNEEINALVEDIFTILHQKMGAELRKE